MRSPSSGASVLARLGDEERRLMSSAGLLFDPRVPRATLFVPVAGTPAGRCPGATGLRFRMI